MSDQSDYENKVLLQNILFVLQNNRGALNVFLEACSESKVRRMKFYKQIMGGTLLEAKKYIDVVFPSTVKSRVE